MNLTDVKKCSSLFSINQTKKFTTDPKTNTAMLLYFFCASFLSTCPKKKMQIEK